MLALAARPRAPINRESGQNCRRSLLLSGMLAIILVGWTATIASASTQDGRPSELKGTNDLRELFRSGGAHGNTPVGRLAVQLVEGGSVREVGLDHPFRTGDRFRFGVSCNQAGWVYVLHRSPAGDPQLLWPRVTGVGHQQRYVDDNRVLAGETSVVPPPPDVFLFDDEVGNEYFYVVIQPKRQVPELSVLTVRNPPANAQAPSPGPELRGEVPHSPEVTSPGAAQRQKIVQFSVKGMGAARAPMRGVVLMPGGEDTDTNAYFAPDPEHKAGNVVFEFRLRHGD